MDRVGFLIEDTGERLGCLLNPETLEISRVAGLKPRRSASGLLTGKGLRDDPLLFTGGGTTEVKMDLLFDVGLAGSSIQTEDVRDLTGPLWQLAENALDDEGVARLRLVRFVWGKAWNIPGVIAAVAERFEDFTGEGIPRRSWLRMRFVRVENPEALSPRPGSRPGLAGEIPPAQLPPPEDILPERIRTHEVVGGPTEAGEGGVSGERLDALAHRSYGDPSYWRWLAVFNRIDDPLRVPAGQVVQVPSLEQRREA
jgi:hypothetical protein